MENTNSAFLEWLEKLTEVLQDRDIYYGGDLCDELQAGLKAAFHSTDQGAAADSRGEGPQVRPILMRHFSRIAVIDASSAVSPNTGFNFDVFLRVIASAMVEAIGLKLDAETLQADELTQLLKDERHILFCFLSVDLLSLHSFQRLRRLGFTKTDHRVLFCGRSQVLEENSASIAGTEGAGELCRGVEFQWRYMMLTPLRKRIDPGPWPDRFSPGAQALLCTYATNTPEIVGRLFPLDQPVLRIGRSRNSDILVPDTTVSGTHAKLTWEGRTWWIEDRGSLNGTYASGSYARITNLQLYLGQEVQLGECRFMLVSFEAESLLHQRARDFLAKHDGLTRLMSRSHLCHALDEEAAFADRAGARMTVARYELTSKSPADSGKPTIIQLLALRRTAILAVGFTATLLLVEIFPVAGRTGPLKLAVALVGPSIEKARQIAEDAAAEARQWLPESMGLGVTLAVLEPGRSGSSLID